LILAMSANNYNYNNNNNNNNNNHGDIYGAVIMAQSHCKSSFY